jgi:hypothetical protein
VDDGCEAVLIISFVRLRSVQLTSREAASKAA